MCLSNESEGNHDEIFIIKKSQFEHYAIFNISAWGL